jgi:hypothetical protein
MRLDRRLSVAPMMNRTYDFRIQFENQSLAVYKQKGWYSAGTAFP